MFPLGMDHLIVVGYLPEADEEEDSSHEDRYEHLVCEAQAKADLRLDDGRQEPGDQECLYQQEYSVYVRISIVAAELGNDLQVDHLEVLDWAIILDGTSDEQCKF